MSTDELELLRTLRADVGVLDAEIDLRIRARIDAGLAASTAAVGDDDHAVDGRRRRGQNYGPGERVESDGHDERDGPEGRDGPDEYGLFEFDATPSEADRRSDTPATLRPTRGRRSRPGRGGELARSSDQGPDQPPDERLDMRLDKRLEQAPDQAADQPADPVASLPGPGQGPGQGPGPGPRPDPVAGRDDAWDIAAAHLARDPDRPARHPARSGHSRVLRVVAVAAALVLLVAGGAAIIRARSIDDRPAPDVDAAAATLSVRDLVALAQSQPARTLAPGQYQYTHLQVGERRDSVTPTGTADPQFVTQDRQRWVAIDGSGREVLGPESARPFSDRASPPRDLGNALDVPLNQPRGFAGFSYADLQTLSTDPDTLRQQLLAANAGVSRDLAGLARLTGHLLEQPVTPPAVRGALLEMLEQDGLRAVGDRTDRLGRRGSGFVLDEGPRRWTYIVDRATGRILGWEQRTVATDVVESDALALESLIPPVTDSTGGP